MDETPKSCEISDEDLRAARREMKGYVDVTEDDLKRIYAIALRHAEQRVARRVSVRDVMTANVIKVRADADISEVTNLLSEHRISGMPVVDGEDRVIGVITEADVLSMAGLRRGHGFKDIIRHILGEPLPGPARQEAPGCHELPGDNDGARSGHPGSGPDTGRTEDKAAPVVDGRGKLIGVISRADIVRTIGAT